MKRIIIEAPDGYDDVITLTLIGQRHGTTNIKVRACDLSKGTHLLFDESGGFVQLKEVGND